MYDAGYSLTVSESINLQFSLSFFLGRDSYVDTRRVSKSFGVSRSCDCRSQGRERRENFLARSNSVVSLMIHCLSMLSSDQQVCYSSFFTAKNLATSKQIGQWQ